MPKFLKQIIPSEACLNCDVCCRYLERTTTLVPSFLPSEAGENKVGGDQLYAVGKKVDLKTPPMPHDDHYICSFFIPDKNMCRIYPSRPLDCQLYPFMVTYDADFKSVALVIDSKCPYIKDKLDSKELKEYADYLTGIVESENVAEEINRNKNFINSFQEDSIILKRLENLSRRVCLSEYSLMRISLKDIGLFDEYFSKANIALSSFSFAAIYIWSSVLNILWKNIGSALCVFAGNDGDYFLLLPPIGDGFDGHATKESLEILSYLNEGSDVPARIENVPKELSGGMASCGLKLKMSSEEYVYRQKELTELKGNRFKAKRAAINNFIKNYKYSYRAFEKDDIFDCLGLYRKWAERKLEDKKDDCFRFLIEDAYFAQKIALMDFELLNLKGQVVEVDGNIKGYSLGYPLNKNMFVTLFETTDLNIKGLSQFLFREFSSQLQSYQYINAMSDSGLKNLKKVKDSYRPIKKIPVFTAYF